MDKRLYDFTKANAIITILAYAFLVTLTSFSLVDKGKLNVVALVVLLLLVVSFVFVLWYFVFMAVRVTNKGVVHGHKFIEKKDCKFVVEYNSRFRVTEIIFYNKYDNLETMGKKDFKKKTITVQHSLEYEEFLNDYFSGRRA